VEQPGPLIIERRTALADAASEWIAAAIVDTVQEFGRCSIALSGGRAPMPVYARLCARRPYVPWWAVTACFGDERCVPPDQRESNFRMADELLLRHVPIPRAQILRMPGEAPDREVAARAYEGVLPDPIDILLLGMGEDGHTASLFPGAPQLAERERRVIPSDSPLPPHARLTITPPVIASARRIAVIVTGGRKGPMVARAREGEYQPDVIPVQLAIRGTWFLGPEAASRLARVSR